MTNATELLLQECAQTFKMIRDLSGNQKIKHDSFFMLEKIGNHLLAQPAAKAVDVDVVEDLECALNVLREYALLGAGNCKIGKGLPHMNLQAQTCLQDLIAATGRLATADAVPQDVLQQVADALKHYGDKNNWLHGSQEPAYVFMDYGEGKDHEVAAKALTALAPFLKGGVSDEV